MRPVAYIDVDDTLVRSVGTRRVPIPATVARVKALHEAGWVLYCWSSVGGDYARESATELGIAGCFEGFLPKPTLMIDDLAPRDWPGFELVHPAELG